MPEDQKSSFSEAVETGASAAHTIRGAIKTGKAISSAAKGAAAGGPYGAVAGAVWAGRKHIGKIIVAVIALLMLPVLFVLMLPGLIFGGLTNAFSPSDPEIPILNSETAIIENANEITFTLNGILGEALDDVLARIEADFAACRRSSGTGIFSLSSFSADFSSSSELMYRWPRLLLPSSSAQKTAPLIRIGSWRLPPLFCTIASTRRNPKPEIWQSSNGLFSKISTLVGPKY